jgi:hypothetical protein
MRVACTISEEEIENEDGVLVDGVIATCSRCDYETESFGTSERSIRRCLVLMREECPEGEANYYVDEDA